MLNPVEGLGIDNSTVNLVATSQTMIADLGGYLEITSGYIGEKGVISLSGDQSVIDALGISTARAAKDNLVEVTLNDSDNQSRVTQIDCDRASGLLGGIDIQFDSQAAQIAGSRGLEQGLYFSSAESIMVEAGGQILGLVVASGYSTLEGIARSFNMQISTVGDPMTIEGLSACVVDGEIRLSYAKPISVSASLGNAVEISFADPSSILGFKNGIYSGFVDSSKNRDALAWGFTSYQPGIVSGEVSTLAVGDGQNSILVELCSATSAAPGVATAADMISFEEFRVKVNQDFIDAGVNVRVDQVGGAMMFTSTLIGRNNVAPGTAYSSMVTIEAVKITATNATISAGESMLRYFGMNAGTKSGIGDSNFRIHIQQSENQYHIGANQMEAMKVSFSEMSAKALGVDNLDMTTVAGAELAIGKLNIAIDRVSAERSKLGAFQNRLEHAINNLRNMHTNSTASESRIRDADIASEMIEYTRNQVVSQSANAMLAQANASAAGVLSLLR
jgi:flagellin-like hook-associated protein FlgL